MIRPDIKLALVGHIKLVFSNTRPCVSPNTRRLETAVTERKDGVLEILLKCEEDILDAKGLVISLKDAKAKVFEILNDLNIEKKNMAQNLEVEVPRYREIAGKMRNFNRILDLLMDSEHASSMLPKTGFIDLIEEIEETSHSPSVFLHKVLSKLLSKSKQDSRAKKMGDINHNKAFVLAVGLNDPWLGLEVFDK